MSSSWFAVAVLLLASTACKERNPAFVGPGTSSGTDASDTADPSSTEATDPTSNPSTFTTTPDPTVETTVDPTGDASSSGTDATASTGPSGDVSYPACDFGAEPECPDGYDDCVDIQDGNWCTVFCDDPSTCPQPTSGTATVECAGPGGNQCALGCDDGAACPDGMQCVQVNGNIDRCVWP